MPTARKKALNRPPARDRLARFRAAIREAGSIEEVRREMAVLSRERRHFEPSISENRILDVVVRWSRHFDAPLVQSLVEADLLERWLENARIPAGALRLAVDLVSAQLEALARGQGAMRASSGHALLKRMRALEERVGLAVSSPAYPRLLAILDVPNNIAEHVTVIEGAMSLLLGIVDLPTEVVKKIYDHPRGTRKLKQQAARHPQAPADTYRRLAEASVWDDSLVATLASLPRAREDACVRRAILGWCAFHDPAPLLSLIPEARGEEVREVVRLLALRAPRLAASVIREQVLEEESPAMREAMDAEVLALCLASEEPELRLSAIRVAGR